MAGAEESIDLARQCLMARNFAPAISLLKEVLKNSPSLAGAHHFIAIAYFETGDIPRAVDHFRRAIQLDPTVRSHWSDYIVALAKLPQAPSDFLPTIDLALKRFSDTPAIWIAVAQHYERLGDIEKLRAVLENAVRFVPGNEAIERARIEHYTQQRDWERAEPLARAVAERRRHDVRALGQLGSILYEQKKYLAAAAIWKKIYCLDSSQHHMLAQYMTARRQACAWDDFDEVAAQVRAVSEEQLKKGGLPAESPLVNISCYMDSEYNLQVARAWSQYHFPRDGSRPNDSISAQPRSTWGESSSGRPIVVGIVSDELRDHPTGQLMQDFFACFDRQRFRIHVYFDHPIDATDAIYQKILSSVDYAQHCFGWPDQKLFDRITADSIDILVDLKGWRDGGRKAVFAQRPSPVNVHFLGYPGTSGSHYIDYILVDRIVAPESDQSHFTERFAYLNRCYQINADSLIDLGRLRVTAGRRIDHGLPSDAIVLASFNQAYKLDPHMFALWLRLLRNYPHTVLWLLPLNTDAQDQLRAFARQHGVSSDRIIFAPWADQDAHLARLTHVDVGLDTRIYNGHTTTSNLLWCQVPVVTMMGSHFASRVSASILHSVGLDELIVNNESEYLQCAGKLIEHRALREQIRTKLQQAHLRETLFNTSLFVKDVENLFLQMIDRWQSGLAPETLHVQR